VHDTAVAGDDDGSVGASCKRRPNDGFVTCGAARSFGRVQVRNWRELSGDVASRGDVRIELRSGDALIYETVVDTLQSQRTRAWKMEWRVGLHRGGSGALVIIRVVERRV